MEYLRLTGNNSLVHTEGNGYTIDRGIPPLQITHTSSVENKNAENKNKKWQKKRFLIVSDSMFDQIDEK